jgi:hypothetical protein
MEMALLPGWRGASGLTYGEGFGSMGHADMAMSETFIQLSQLAMAC